MTEGKAMAEKDEFWETMKTAGTLLIRELAETEKYFEENYSGSGDTLA
jgi:hypothetical protein